MHQKNCEMSVGLYVYLRIELVFNEIGLAQSQCESKLMKMTTLKRYRWSSSRNAIAAIILLYYCCSGSYNCWKLFINLYQFGTLIPSEPFFIIFIAWNFQRKTTFYCGKIHQIILTKLEMDCLFSVEKIFCLML